MANVVLMTGNLTADPEMRYTQTGKPVTSFRIGCNEGSGDNRTSVFINCESWERLAETVAEWGRKGRKVLVVGSLADDSYKNREGKQVTAYKLKCRNVEFLDHRDVEQEPAAAQVEEPDLTGIQF